MLVPSFPIITIFFQEKFNEMRTHDDVVGFF
jgi:hypothetical protein